MPWPGSERDCLGCGVRLVWAAPWPVDGRMPMHVQEAITRLGRWEQLDPPTFREHRCRQMADVVTRILRALEQEEEPAHAVAPTRPTSTPQPRRAAGRPAAPPPAAPQPGPARNGAAGGSARTIDL